MLPISALVMWAMYRRQKKTMQSVGLHLAGTFGSFALFFFFFFFFYQLVMSPTSVLGYGMELAHAPREW